MHTFSPSARAVKSTTVRFFERMRRGVPLRVVRFLLGGLSRVAPGLTSRWFERRFLTPKRYRRPTKEQQVLRRATPFTFRSGGRRLAGWWWSKRGGRWIVLVHGWEGRGSQLGAFVAPLVDAGFHVVTFDAPGHGSSEGRRSSLVEMAWAIRDLGEEMAARGMGPIYAVVAHSAGVAAAQYAVRTGLVVERFVAVSPPDDLGRFAREVASIVGLTPEVTQIMRRRVEKRLGLPWEELRTVENAPAMTMPLLAFHDHDDRVVPHAAAVALSRSWPGARLVTTRGLGHRRILRSDEVVGGTVEYLRGAV